MTLLPSRKLSAAFVGVFLIGGLVGGLLVMAFTDMKLSHFMTVTSDPQSMATRVNQKYVQAFNLNADEQARIAPLIREMTQHLYLVRRQFGVDIIATLDDYHQKIGAQMSPEHREAFEKWLADRKKRMSSMLLLDQPPVETGGK
jgi:uncharacterized membrane protein